jgi:hypothetical protein
MAQVTSSNSTADHSTQQISARLEALKLVKEWSAGLIVVQSGAIAVIGAFLQTVPSGWRLGLVIALLALLIFSIFIGAVAVLGTLPYIVQNLPNHPEQDIYDWRGGIEKSLLPFAKLRLGSLCLWQSRLFIMSMILFAIFAVSREHSAPEATHFVIDQPVKVQTLDTPQK